MGASSVSRRSEGVVSSMELGQGVEIHGAVVFNVEVVVVHVGVADQPVTLLPGRNNDTVANSTVIMHMMFMRFRP